MDIDRTVTVRISPKQLKEIVTAHLLKNGVTAESIYFEVGGHETEGDWQAALPLDYRLDRVVCTGKEIKDGDSGKAN